MDNLTHTLVGLMLARTGLGKETPRAAGLMMLAANAPDIDVISWFGGTPAYLDYHRGYTHALAFVPIVALLPMTLVRAKFSWRVYAAAVIGVLSHLMLDFTNIYGVRLFLPFSARWQRLDMTDVVDPWIWLVLILGVLIPRFFRPNGGVSRGPARMAAWVVLVALLGYEGTRYAFHRRALQMIAAQMDSRQTVECITAVPDRFDPRRWRGIVETGDAVEILPLNLSRPYDPEATRVDEIQPRNEAMIVATQSRAFRALVRFSQLPYWRTSSVTNGTRVELIDLRFGTPENPGLEAEAIVDPSSKVIFTGVGFGPPR